jgi:hypothetical protein
MLREAHAWIFLSNFKIISLVLEPVRRTPNTFLQPANWAMRRVIILEFREIAATRWLLQADSDRSDHSKEIRNGLYAQRPVDG